MHGELKSYSRLLVQRGAEIEFFLDLVEREDANHLLQEASCYKHTDFRICHASLVGRSMVREDKAGVGGGARPRLGRREVATPQKS